MQIAAYKPQFISAENVPQEVIEQQTKFYENQTREEGKPENVIPKIVEGKLKKYLDMTCLIGQAYIRDENKKISDIVKEASSKTNDTIKIMKFSRYELGEA